MTPTRNLQDNDTPPVLIATARRANADALQRVLAEAGFRVVVCDDLEVLCAELPTAAAAVVGENVLNMPSGPRLADALRDQPEWSDFPLILITVHSEMRAFTRRLFGEIEGRAHPVLLRRPVGRSMLLSAVRAGVRARQRQHQVRDELVRRRRAEEALRDADRLKDEFLATLGHELRNPLASVSAALAVTDLTDDPQTIEKSRAIMKRQVGRLSRLVDDLLEVSRIARGKFELEKRPIELASIVRSAVEDTEDMIGQRGHELRLDMLKEPVLLYADPVRLGQVFANLLHNAAKYTPYGGRIVLSAERDAGSVTVSIRDTGIGLAPEALETVFEMFGQVGDALGRRDQGLGIGLSLVKSLVELHGGTVNARSDGLDRGSEFRVRLPTAAQQTATRPATADDTRSPGRPARRCRVLLVEDEPDAAESLAALTELLGHEVRIERDGEAAAGAADFRADLALLDLGLPKLSGYDVARRLRDQTGGDTIVLAAVTGWGQEWHQRQAREAGFDLHLTKPIDLETLRALLDIVATHQSGARRLIDERRGPGRAGQPGLPLGGRRSAE